MKQLSTVILIFFFLATGLKGQRAETLFGDSGLKLTGLWGGATFGTTFFNDAVTSMRGGFFGAEFNKILLAGIGSERTHQSVDIGNRPGESFDLKFKGLILGISPQSHKVVHPQIRFDLGGGEVKMNDGRTDGIFIVQPGAGLEINIFTWWKTGLVGGYRFVSGSTIEGLENEDLSAFYLNIRLRFGLTW